MGTWLCLGEARGNASLALRIYRERFPNVHHPGDSRTITAAFQRLLENQPIVPVAVGGGRPIDIAAEERILDVIQRNPRLGTRTAAKLLQRPNGPSVSHWTVYKVLRRNRMRPYKIHKVQALIPEDLPRRRTFCRWLLDQQQRLPGFIQHVIWTDESTFTRNGMWNRRNSHLCSETNPRATQETGHQTRWFINESLDEILEGISLAELRRAWFQHDGATPHVVRLVRERLTELFGDRWIGRLGPQAWPPRSPDLTPLDFFLWGCVKEKVFNRVCDSAEEMRARIVSAFETIRTSCIEDSTLMPRLHEETRRRARICVEMNGAQFEPHFSENSSDNITIATVDWVVKKYLPFSFFDDEATQVYFRRIFPNMVFPKRSTLRRKVKERFEGLQLNLKERLQQLSSKMSLTIDGWTLIAGRSYYGVTMHCIDNEWKYRSVVLDFIPPRGRHTGEDIATVFHECLLEYDIIDKIQGITVDNATANTKFMNELGKQLPPYFDSDNQHFRCFAYILNLGVQDLLKTLALHCETDTNAQDQQYEDYADETDKIKRSEIVKKKFQSACEAAGVPSNLNPILDCPTRWNSTHDMIGFGLKVRAGINILCSSITELNDFQITASEWQILEKIHKFLINFKLLSTKLGGEKYVILPLFIVSFNLLLDKIESMVKQLDEKPNRSEVDERLILAAVRDKMLKYYKKKSLRKFNELYEEYYSLHSLNKSLKLPRKENKVCDEDKDVINFDKLYECPSTSSGSCLQGLVIDELEEYLRKPRAASSEDILDWWRTHETEGCKYSSFKYKNSFTVFLIIPWVSRTREMVEREKRYLNADKTFRRRHMYRTANLFEDILCKRVGNMFNLPA
ncbi:unnamed protein product [Diatraea saccharalis]|uniref:Transposase n=1 Tax=Diatraea saccharalis TaxID=40085 RepID=A0A9N9WE08_9NEOP|nr:unnamed protein product [Diatraea saccharalis]